MIHIKEGVLVDPSWLVLKSRPADAVAGAVRHTAMIKRVLVALDGSEHANKAMDLAWEIADRFGAELVALHVIPDKPLSDSERKMAEVEFRTELPQSANATPLPETLSSVRPVSRRLAEQAAITGARFRWVLGERLIEAAAWRAKEGSVANVRTILDSDDPATVILRTAHDEAADLIVMGRRGSAISPGCCWAASCTR
ncbi:MAG TPA: universal stress protein [Geminicoccaceae bacterium]|nr:universal stress protein [Geminicoccaceae bacterium]